ncbi:ESX-1 secretion-associated protein [Mycobacterium sp.]|uniref:ESX-1 secretion-associated protein n=1 Tax=Mycobacterium sp. TaxID=1785 RepID=UPI003BA8EA8D
MVDRIHVVPAHLRKAATHHQETSDYLRTVPASHAAIQQSLDSLGPIFSELRASGRELLELRRQCYQQQADDHADMADNLETSATMWEQHEEDAAGEFGSIVDDGR